MVSVNYTFVLIANKGGDSSSYGRGGERIKWNHDTVDDHVMADQ